MNTTNRYCDYEACTRRATTEYTLATKDPSDGVDIELADRCASHPVQDPRFSQKPIKQTPGTLHPVFAEALAPFMPALVEARPHTFSVCCGSPVSDDGRCTSCWETVEVL